MERITLLLSDYSLTDPIVKIGNIQHVYSHFRLQAEIFYKKTENVSGIFEENNGWFSLDELQNIALHGAHKKAVAKLKKSGV